LEDLHSSRKLFIVVHQVCVTTLFASYIVQVGIINMYNHYWCILYQFISAVRCATQLQLVLHFFFFFFFFFMLTVMFVQDSSLSVTGELLVGQALQFCLIRWQHRNLF